MFAFAASPGRSSTAATAWATSAWSSRCWRTATTISASFRSAPRSSGTFRSIAPDSAPLIVDAGANIGASALYFLDAYPGSRVVAIEPEPNNCTLLRRNCSGLPVHLIEAAIGPREGRCALQDPGMSDWAFRVDPASAGPHRYR
jgi:hypothetical protein